MPGALPRPKWRQGKGVAGRPAWDRAAYLAAALGIAACGTGPAVAAPVPAADGWKLVFADDFDGTALDAAKWTPYEDCWGGGNQERQCYSASGDNIAVHDGQLDLVARFEKASGPALALDMRTPGTKVDTATKPFTSGKISTKGKFALTYGRIEVRAKSPLGQGVWPAIWLLPETNAYGRWPGSGEIDVMETVNLGARCTGCVGGVENQIYGTIHYGSFMHHQFQQHEAVLPKGTEGDWHTYRVDWAPDTVTWLIDGQRYAQVRLANWRDTLQRGDRIENAVRKAPFDRPFHLILNLAIGGLWPESHNEGGVVLKDYPKTFAIDWVHMYSCERDTGCD